MRHRRLVPSVAAICMWDESAVGLKANDTASHTLTFSNPAGHPPGAFGVKKYVVWNTREGVAEPGQWYLDRGTGRVLYWPLPGEDMTKAEAIAPIGLSRAGPR